MSNSSNVVGYLITLAVFCFFTLGNPLLEAIGIPYTTPGSILIARFHPGTYVILVALIILLFTNHATVGFRNSFLWNKAAAAFLIFIILLSTYLLLTPGQSGFSYIVNTYATPVMIYFVYENISDSQQQRVYRVAIFLLIFNSLIAIGEDLTKIHLIGANYGGEYFRATAFLGHPLNNALITAPTVLLVIGGRGSVIVRFLIALIFLGALFAYGGRAAIFATAAFLIVGFAFETFGAIFHGRLRRSIFSVYTAIFLITPFLIAATMLLTTFGERLLGTLYFDSSAAERVQVFNIFDYMTENEVLFGIDSTTVDYLLERQLNIGGIENYWLYLVIQLGIIIFIPFSILFLGYLLTLGRGGDLYAWLAILTFLVVSSGNNSLAAKTTALSTLTLFVLHAKAQRRHASVQRGDRSPWERGAGSGRIVDSRFVGAGGRSSQPTRQGKQHDRRPTAFAPAACPRQSDRCGEGDHVGS